MQASYYAEYADIGAYDLFNSTFLFSNGVEANKLAAYDLAICRAFSYKLQSFTTDKSFSKLPYAFPADPPLPKIDAIRSRIASLSGIEPEIYDVCINTCICYVGPHESRTVCPFCKEKRFHDDGRPQKTWPYIPIIPRLRGFAMNTQIAAAMQYRHHFTTGTDKSCSKPGVIKDVFDGEIYKELRNKHVVVGEQTLSHHYFHDHCDVALGLSTDGFGPFKHRKQTC
ncbi:hypothetical protein K435DRAFT_664101, partial [Dendrothele bispora CBS 962.96]